ncbi:family 20 glycosylhydrolase [Sphingobacterium suaedae]|uniref:beta-N-acetylhexosaminidase n=1 Tax=Sphingobacterium suaedae TaxID=1686402 RepID=A0ABW5KID9_9SPHI
MKQLKIMRGIALALLMTGYGVDAIGQSNEVKNLSLTWRASSVYDGKDNLDLDIVLKNTTEVPISLRESDLWFNAIYPILEKETSRYQLSDENGNLFRIRFKEGVKVQPSDSLVVTYTTKYPIVNVSNVPNGFYFQDRNDASEVTPLAISARSILPSGDVNDIYWATLYEKNKNRHTGNNKHVVLPSPKTVKKGIGTLTLSGTYAIAPAFMGEEKNVREILDGLADMPSLTDPKTAQINIREKAGYGPEAYFLKIDGASVTIEASHAAGVFYALQSLRSLRTISTGGQSSAVVPCLEIRDEPRYAYRGFMMDIARNFKDKSIILKYIDLMSRYKLNTFHIHFIDDEGWRIEIPALPELTEIGANRTPLFREDKGIQPSYGSGATSTSRHYLSRQDFIEILKYAKRRHVTIVPEIETPGHARASIKAMEVRYKRFVAKGDKAEAEKYLLHDFEDKSVYSSAQYWNDNVMNVALPSVYTFIGEVLDEFKRMYAEAGVPLTKVSLGGDEVPTGSWEKSPKIKSLMDSLQMGSVYEVWPYYIDKVNRLCQAKGLQLAGWEEMGMVNKGKGMEVNHQLASDNIQLDVWNNLVGGGQEDLAYRLANAGYPTVFISANNNYFDMAWDTNFEEPGLKWASYSDLYQSYTFLPEDFFATIHHSINGARLKKGDFNGKTRLTEKGRAHLLGIKGGLWAETVVSEDRLDYMIFPRFFSLAERAWSPRRSYESESAFDLDAFNKDYSALLNKISEDELPRIHSVVAYRLPAVGVKEENGKLYVNTEYPGFDVYYTTDGSVPTQDSRRYTDPVNIKEGATYQFVVISPDNRRGTVSTIKR